MIDLARRRFIAGAAASLLAAPAIVRASSLMRIKPERVIMGFDLAGEYSDFTVFTQLVVRDGRPVWEGIKAEDVEAEFRCGPLVNCYRVNLPPNWPRVLYTGKSA